MVYKDIIIYVIGLNHEKSNACQLIAVKDDYVGIKMVNLGYARKYIPQISEIIKAENHCDTATTVDLVRMYCVANTYRVDDFHHEHSMKTLVVQPASHMAG